MGVNKTSPAPIRVAIIGGGLAGLALANALVHRSSEQLSATHPGFEVHVYEAKPSFSERSANVSVGAVATKALSFCLPDARGMLQRAGAVLNRSRVVAVGAGEHAGESFIMGPSKQDEDKAPEDERGYSVHRARLLKGLMATLEDHGNLHTSKRLALITTKDKEVDITFTDGQVKTFDAVIGADGYSGIVRSHVLGDKADQEAVSASGFWDCRNLVPMQTAKDSYFRPLREALRAHTTPGDIERYFGTGDDFDQHRMWFWRGDSGFVMHDVCNDGETVQFVICSVEKEPWKERKLQLTKEIVKQHLDEGWMKGPVLPLMLDLMFLKEQPTEPVYGYSEWQHKKTSTYHNGRVCIIGDAAHASIPFSGAGAMMAFEDAMILSHLLCSIPSKEHVAVALETFTETRKDRCQGLVDLGEENGRRGMGLVPELGSRNAATGVVSLDPAKVKTAMAGSKDKVLPLNCEHHRKEAKARLDKKLGTQEGFQENGQADG